MLNDYEPAVHARNLILLQLFLDSRGLLESSAAGITAGVAAVNVQGGEGKAKNPPAKEVPPRGEVNARDAAFAQRIGVIFRSGALPHRGTGNGSAI